ncbi:palmitoyl-(protein) hydrolase NDAI_0G02650 [Naumovozyma dairenensis CBS 421]|uniref:Acyl-protein thioesterase 1 n=1 Tax=Naumovozyma dairenensis (strain ATCC 10597 / BCRC 20456 / CBS 421 / NBRC 0211 / NRRL Y-12639) TaxID=1071378 RepID=G0WE31_NAUDC|nr:hypothetical protein NDAI_0G02650 [Naumovozyma dairenensis CBS 421]CCD26042.2 hypothetical protein NDAI_0G02650 [Naumovozyma dairenensis CBS 421]
MNNILRIAPKLQPVKQSIIVLHGLGDTADGWRFLAQELTSDKRFHHTQFILPNAPNIPVYANGNATMPAWFNIHEWNLTSKNVDVDGIMQSVDLVTRIVKEEIDNGVKPEDIAIGGFSQGAAISLASVALLPYKIGAFFVFSGFCQIEQKLIHDGRELNLETPVFHGHGGLDNVVPEYCGELARGLFKDKLKYKNYNYHTYRSMEHSVCPEELVDFREFIVKALKL